MERPGRHCLSLEVSLVISEPLREEFQPGENTVGHPPVPPLLGVEGSGPTQLVFTPSLRQVWACEAIYSTGCQVPIYVTGQRVYWDSVHPGEGALCTRMARGLLESQQGPNPTWSSCLAPRFCITLSPGEEAWAKPRTAVHQIMVNVGGFTDTAGRGLPDLAKTPV